MKKATISNEEYKQKLTSLKLTQKEFAKIIGISEDTAKGWYTKTNMPYWAQVLLSNMEELNNYKQITDGLSAIGKLLKIK